MPQIKTISHMRPKKILVTGGAGFIGSHFVSHWLNKKPDCSITVLDNLTYAASPETFRRFKSDARIELMVGDVRNCEAVKQAARDQDCIFHFAAETHVPRSFSNPDLFFDTNVQGTRNLVREAMEQRNCRLIHVSTDEVYGSTQKSVSESADFNPTTPYARSKVEAERVVMAGTQQGLDAVIVRPTNAIGTRQHDEKLTPRFVNLVLQNRPLTIEGTGEQERCFVPVKDLARAITLIADRASSGEVFNVPGDEALSVIEFAQLVCAELNRQCNLVHIPDRVVNDANYRICGKKLAALGYVQSGTVAEEIRNVALRAMQEMRLAELGGRREPLQQALVR